MKIVFVIDQYGSLNNGTTASAQRTKEYLESLGHEVKVLAANIPLHDYAGLEEVETLETIEVPIFQELIDQQGFALAKRADTSVYQKAFADADLVHFYVPSLFCKKGAKVARAMNKPVSTAFHIQPKNITYSLGLGNKERVNQSLYSLLHRFFYKDFSFIHCPSQMVADALREEGYQGDLRVISNGISEYFKPVREDIDDLVPKDFLEEGSILLLTVGRLSGEKRQDILLDAVQYSEFKERIKVVVGGQGPNKEKLIKQAAKLGLPLHLSFYNQEELRRLYSRADLYAHPADAETEGISCMEAIACGAVPVISNSPFTATQDFALYEESLFNKGDPRDLAAKIDWWLKHPDKKKEAGEKYAEYGKSLSIRNSIAAFEKFFKDAAAAQGAHVRD